MSIIFVRVCAVLITLRSLTNLAKFFKMPASLSGQGGEETILVLFGQILRGGEAAVPALIVGLFMLVTAIGLWKPAKWGLPLIAVYATYVLLNLVLWTGTNPQELVRVGGIVSSATDPSELRIYGALLMVVYSIVALGTTAGPAWVLWKRRTPQS
jgi:hypothetical protein